MQAASSHLQAKLLAKPALGSDHIVRAPDPRRHRSRRGSAHAARRPRQPPATAACDCDLISSGAPRARAALPSVPVRIRRTYNVLDATGLRSPASARTRRARRNWRITVSVFSKIVAAARSVLSSSGCMAEKASQLSTWTPKIIAPGG
eukprot:COSAG05_NODE_4213_length_1618_cov_1.351547_2_plen_148_part_00